MLRIRRPGQRSGVLTFRSHPGDLLAAGHRAAVITTLGGAVVALGGGGVDDLYLLPFDEAIASLSAEDFVRTI